MAPIQPGDDAADAAARRTAARSPGRPWPAGAWYFAITVLSAGLLAAKPFWHAASRSRRSGPRRLALLYTVADVVLFVLLAVTPERQDGSTANSAISTTGGFLVLLVVVAGCIQLRPLRREVYDSPERALAERDPVVARALAARAKREEARRILAQDPGLARDLGIGRPDLRRGFDDGGLVDLNSADAPVIASVCAIHPKYADAVVAARRARGGTYFNLGEVLVDVDLPPDVQEALRDRGFVRSGAGQVE